MSSDQGKATNASFWDEKPWWCQPWSILLTGVAFVAFSWWWPNLLWFTVLIAIGVIGWWGLFLVLAPAVYRQQIQQQLSEQDQISS
ncbi:MULTISPECIES: DUF6737 family protein [unclassified Prochlorococcus]|uniref:DUF6737 family protein n=1 Tax=unclassified Prochlorococcus TaxID=2627481 RepID=UPI0005337FE0|nr:MULTISPECIES: DUF6737 family protein [unclassified Prochlorococcus]KGG24992.1 hypothetical protein EV12_2871 [Prochlorococcus sp. MIT 0701]KGG26144.1 hypothetical protein EV13_2925 [Prochlorococcus sp. MIT 0702]KGG32968.1 hypothetical protein EV14_1809 [Prochlorococcus sp. MIT 0703]